MPRRADPTLHERRRAEILAAARECFAEKGFHATSMRELQRSASLPAGTFYEYFKSKEEIVAAVADAAVAEVFAVLAHVDAAATSLDDALRQIIHALERLDLSRGAPRIVIALWGEARGTTTLAPIAARSIQPVVEWFELFVRELNKRGEITSIAGRSSSVATALVGLVQAFLIQRALQNVSATDYCLGLQGLRYMGSRAT